MIFGPCLAAELRCVILGQPEVFFVRLTACLTLSLSLEQVFPCLPKFGIFPGVGEVSGDRVALV